MRRLVAILAALSTIGAVVATAVAAQGSPSEPIALERAKMIIEVNDTDGDAGVQFFLDGDPWRSIRIDDPHGQKILDVNAEGALKHFGLTELFSESNEPDFEEDDFSIDELKALFPAGEYAFSGMTIEGEKVTGTATLSHAIPDAPQNVSVDTSGVITWDEVTTPEGIEIAGYQVIVDREGPPLRTFSVDLGPDATSVTIPPEFFAAGIDKVEVLAVEAGGNQTITERTFETA